MCNSSEKTALNEAHLKKLYWRSRRGLLELDLLLPPFLAECYASLDITRQLAYETLLSCEDPDILSWLNAHSTPEDLVLRDIVELIRRWNSTRSS